MINLEDEDDFDPFAVSSRFKIPKAARSGELLQSIEPSSADFKRITGIIDLSLKLGSPGYFKYESLLSVRNERLESEYSARRKELREKVTPDPVQESFAFLHFESEEKAAEICRNGLSTGNFRLSSLANSKLGVTLFRHADISSDKPMKKNYTGFIVIFKASLGKSKAVSPTLSGSQLDPDPNFDCYSSAEYSPISKWTTQANSLRQLFTNAQLYFFEYDMESYEAVEKPRHVLPYALVKFRVMVDAVPLSESASTVNVESALSPTSKTPKKRQSTSADDLGVSKNIKRKSLNANAQPLTPLSGRTLPAQMLIPLGKTSKPERKKPADSN